ncbi:transmembrane protein, putative (macronuclear) [Tetrahymena thermophila SB210]|uniref:Transmembrane protein, putative n=1 Tax=Tetrahymena thermophila (strain SB210) TaxID=312017 RepID=Q23FY9_TETTS|nr:transmembrane protein, putative [Tetrahymena thermophila SB210]EAR95471.2 transmembrane protein, putative [Tetrahymena thermophila SB210]|eukprot:XP_001015716.2 transmembrane protein, putative [Tetrahymena thermophila SB210]
MMLSYISYLFEIMNISTRSYNMIFNYQNKMFQRQLLSLKEFQSLNTIFLRLNKQFENFFKSPKIQNQRIQMMLIIDFDEYIEVFRQQIRYYLLILGEYYDYLCSNFIKLEELHNQSKQILEKLEKCQQLQNWLFDINPDDKQLLYLATIYSNILDFRNRKLVDFVTKSQQLTQQFIIPQEINLQKFFNPNTCAIYASLNTAGGEIKKVSNNFSNIFNFKNQSIISKSINQLIPRGMFNDHDDFLSNFKSKGNMSIINQGIFLFIFNKFHFYLFIYQIKFYQFFNFIKLDSKLSQLIFYLCLFNKFKQVNAYQIDLNFILKGERMVFGFNSQGFIFPIMIRLKIENILGELGICAYITNLYETNEFIFIDSNENISDVTENLYLNTFSTVYSKSQLVQKNINQILPISMIIKQLQEYNLNYQTVMILQKKQLYQSPKKGTENFNFNQGQTFKLLNQKLAEISERDAMFAVNVQIRQIFTQIGKKYYYLEISHINHLRDYDEKRNYLNKLRECLDQYEEYDQANANGKTFSEINNLKFDQLNKLDQTASRYFDSEKQLSQSNESVSEQIQVEDQTVILESSVKKRSHMANSVKRTHLNEKELILFTNMMAQQGNTAYQSLYNQNIQEKSIEQSQLQKYFNFEFSRFPLQEEVVLQELQLNDLNSADNQLPFSPKENSHRQLLMQHNTNDINSQAEEENLFQQNQNSSKKFQQISTEIFSKVAQEQEQQTASSPTLKNQSQFKRNMSQKQKRNQRRKGRRQTTKLVIKKYESTNRICEDSSKFSNDQNNFYEKKEDKGNDAQSVQSVNTNLSEQKKQQIINQINSQNSSFIVKIFIISVIFSFITLVCVSSIQYDQLNQSIDRYYLDFQQLNLFNQMNDINLIVLSQKTFLELFKNSPQLAQSTFNQTFLQAEMQRSQIYLNQQLANFTLKTLRAINADPSQNYQKVFVTKNTSLNFTDYTVENSNQYIRNFTVINELLIFRQQYFEVLTPQTQSLLAEKTNNRMDFLWDNYLNIFRSSYTVQGAVEDQVKQEFSYIDNVQLLNLIVLLVVVGVLVVLVVPMNILGQIQAEKILKLLGSFQPDKLQKYVDLIEYCIIKVDEMVDNKQINYRDLDEVLKQNSNQIVSSNEHYNKEMNIEEAKNINVQSNVNGDKMNIIHRIQNKRTRSVASFNSLQKISLPIIFISLVVIFIQMIYPIVSLLVIAQFKKEGEVVISERISIFDATSLILDYHANHYGYWLTNYILQQSPSSQDFYRADQQMQNIVRLHQSGDDYLQKVSNIMADTQIKRKNQQKFEDIFITMLNQDICQVIQNYPQYFAIEIQQIDCENIMSGVLSRGFIITMKQISQYFTGFLQLYQQLQSNSIPQKSITQYLIDIQKQSNLIDGYNQLIRYLKLISFALDNYLFESQVDYYNYIVKLNQYLFIMQLIIIIMTFIFGWTFFYKKFTNKLKEVKNLLKLFHINLILDNQIFMAYFKKNKNQLV